MARQQHREQLYRLGRREQIHHDDYNRIKAAKSDNMSPIAYDLIYGDSGTRTPRPNKSPGRRSMIRDTRMWRRAQQNQQIWIMDVSIRAGDLDLQPIQGRDDETGLRGRHLDNLGAATSYRTTPARDQRIRSVPEFHQRCKPQLQSVNFKATLTRTMSPGTTSTPWRLRHGRLLRRGVGLDHYNDIRT